MGSQPVKIYIPLRCSSLLRTHVTPAVGNREGSAVVRNEMFSASDWAKPHTIRFLEEFSEKPATCLWPAAPSAEVGGECEEEATAKAHEGRARDKTGRQQQPRTGARMAWHW